MAKGELDRLEFDTSNGLAPDVALAQGTIHAIVYEGSSDDILVKTVSVDSDGVIGSILDTITIDAGTCRKPRIIQLTSGFLAIVYEGTGSEGFLATISVSAGGSISLVDSWEFDASAGREPFIINISGTTYAILYRNSGLEGQVKTVTISNTGVITKSFIDSLQFDTNISPEPSMIKIAGDIWAISYSGTNGTGNIKTVDIDSAGNIGVAVIDTFQFADGVAATSLIPVMIHISGTIYACVYEDTKPNPDTIELFTVDIQNDGTIAAAVTDSFQLAVDAGGECKHRII